jgi:hypothetical protein
MHTLTDMIAKSVVKNKFWVVEENGKKIATIQATDAGFVYVHDNEREKFATIKVLTKKYNITFDTARYRPAKEDTHHCYGYPTSSKPYNQIWDVQRKLPIYTKTEKSRSLYCAGYYAIKFGAGYVAEYCPKNITTSRNEFVGPFKTKEQLQEFLAAKDKQCN